MAETVDGMRMRYNRWLYLILLLIFIALWITVLKTPASAEESATPTEMVIILSPTINTDATEQIWNILREEFTETATAAIIGNLAYESGLYPYRVEGFNAENSLKVSNSYVKDIDKYIYSWSGYGLASWTGYTNHKRMAEWCEENGYAIDSVEGQVRFLMADYEYMAPGSYERINHYEPADIVAASEDFRQSYEKSHITESSQWGRARYAKSAYCNYGDETYYDTVLNAPYYFDIYLKVNALNEELGIKRKYSY